MVTQLVVERCRFDGDVAAAEHGARPGDARHLRAAVRGRSEPGAPGQGHTGAQEGDAGPQGAWGLERRTGGGRSGPLKHEPSCQGIGACVAKTFVPEGGRKVIRLEPAAKVVLKMTFIIDGDFQSSWYLCFANKLQLTMFVFLADNRGREQIMTPDAATGSEVKFGPSELTTSAEPLQIDLKKH